MVNSIRKIYPAEAVKYYNAHLGNYKALTSGLYDEYTIIIIYSPKFSVG